MASKKVAPDRRARLPRASDYTSQFLKDWRRINEAGRSDMARAKRVMLLLLAADAPLSPEYKDHALGGNWKGYRDCHLHGDFLLIYKIEGKGDDERVIFTRLGTHSDLFEGRSFSGWQADLRDDSGVLAGRVENHHPSRNIFHRSDARQTTLQINAWNRRVIV